MKKRLFPALLGLIFVVGSAQATRVLEVLERSYELRLSETTLPQSTQGRVGYKACDDCAYEYMTVSESTAYFVGQRPVTLGEFAEEAARIRLQQGAAAQTLMMLHYDPQTEIATRIRISTP